MKDGQPAYWTTKCAQQSDGAYRFIAFNMDNKRITNTNTGGVAFSDSQKWIFKVRLIAKDNVSTGTYTATIKNAILSNSVDQSGGTAVVNGANCPIKDSEFKIQINAKIGAGGYGTFSWPRAVVFGDDVKVFTAKSEPKNGSLHLDEVVGNKVPAGTGVIIKGTAGIVNPETTEDEVDAVETILGETSAETYTAGSNVFVLKTVDGRAGFQPAAEGLVIPKYKAYLTSASGAKMITFGDTTTGINAMDAATEEGDIYTLGGQKVQKTTMKGVYIKNGKKVVVK